MASSARNILVQDIKMSATDWLVDCVIAAGAFGFGLIQMTLSANLFVPDAFTRMLLGIRAFTPGGIELLALFLTCAPLIARRKLPWPVFAFCLIMWAAFDWGTHLSSLPMIGVLVALFTVTYVRGRIEVAIACLATLMAIVISPLLSPNSNLSTLLLFQNASIAVAVSLAGYALHTRQDNIAQVEARARQAEELRESETKRAQEAERTRETEALRRVEEERVRIAREVHDITAHSLSAVSIQAAAAERLIGTDPQAAKEAIQQVRATAKDALGNIRGMIGVLRGEGDAETAPTYGTDRLGDLVDYLEDAGISCALDMLDLDRDAVPQFIDVALFGIAREACTNIVRHSQARHATISVRTDGANAVLKVADDGCGFDIVNAVASHGIDGMRERASLLDGELKLTSAPGQGTQLEVIIPVGKGQDG